MCRVGLYRRHRLFLPVDLYHYKKTRMARGERTAAQAVKGIRRLAGQRLRKRWKESLTDSPYGIRILEVVLSVIFQRVSSRQHGLLTYRLV